MSDDLSDSIDYSELSPSSEDVLDKIIPVSSDLLSSLDESSSDELKSDVTTSAILKADELLSQFESIEKSHADHIARRTEQALFTSVQANEEYFKSVASLLYVEVHKAAKKYLKDWCRVNDYRQKWANPFARPFRAKSLNMLSAFIPKIYTLSIVKLVELNAEEQVLADMMPTAREASIIAAKRLGFDDSTERKLAFSKFSAVAVEKIVNDPRYLNEQRQLHIFEEHRRQVEARHYVPKSLREKWLKEIQDKTAFSGGII